MTPIATKNNAIILKDGKLAENCGCCGGWYCCALLSECDARFSVAVQIAASDVTGVFTRAAGQCGTFVGGDFYPSGVVSHTAVRIRNIYALSGSHVLQYKSQNAGSRLFEKSVTDTAGCTGSIISVALYESYLSLTLTCNEYSWQQQVTGPTPSAAKAIAQMSCSDSGGSSLTCSPQEAYGRVARVAMSKSATLVGGQCWTESQTVQLQQAADVSVPMYNFPAQDSPSFQVIGGQTNTSYSGFHNISASVTVSLA
jgi:hypothetical protein